MNESVIKEIKSIYSGKIKSNNPIKKDNTIKSINPSKKENKSFFNGVIDKLNIVVSKNQND